MTKALCFDCILNYRVCYYEVFMVGTNTVCLKTVNNFANRGKHCRLKIYIEFARVSNVMQFPGDLPEE